MYGLRGIAGRAQCLIFYVSMRELYEKIKIPVLLSTDVLPPLLF